MSVFEADIAVQAGGRVLRCANHAGESPCRPLVASGTPKDAAATGSLLVGSLRRKEEG